MRVLCCVWLVAQCVAEMTSWAKSKDNQARSDPEDTIKIDRCEDSPFVEKQAQLPWSLYLCLSLAMGEGIALHTLRAADLHYYLS